jgi:DNA modification methylase
MTIDSMHDGVFLTDGLEGLRKLPSSSIDIIITDPPENPGEEKIDLVLL